MKNLTATSLCVSALCLSCVVLAQTVSQSLNYPSADAAAFHGNQKTLTTAIQTIQQSTGGKVVEIRFAVHNGTPGFHTAVEKGGQVQFAFLDQSSGTVAAGKTQPDWMLKWQQRTDAKLAESAPISLSQAIATAEMSKSAPAIAAGMARSASSAGSNVHAYNVLLDQGGSIKRVAVDSSTGEIIADPGALETWP
jgi:uncharacterized membrane protein YkoI